jgi:uncharacterized protein
MRHAVKTNILKMLVVVWAASLWVSGAQAREMQSHFALVQKTIDTFVLPRFEALDAAAAKLPGAVGELCAAGDDGAREAAQSHFRATVEAWAAVEFLRFGPVTAEGRRERFSFWPDPRGVMARQLRQFLTSKDVKALDGGAFAKQSAALQGLPALEVLLTDKEAALGPGEAVAYRCQFAKAIAGNLAGLAREMRDGWSKDGGWKDKMLRPGSDNETYKEPTEAAGEFVKALLTGLQLLGDTQAKPRLQAQDKAAHDAVVADKISVTGPFEKSDLAREYFMSGAKSAEALYLAMDLEGYLPEDKDWVRNWAGGAWKTIRESNGAGGVAPGVKKKDAPPLRELVSKIGALRQLIGKEMASAAGLTLGFNELDGD